MSLSVETKPRVEPPGPELPRPERTLRALSALARQARKLFLLEGLLGVALILVGLVAASFVLDYFLALPRAVRALFLIAGGVWVALRLWQRVIRAAERAPDLEELASLVEREHPGLRQSLITAVQLTRRSHSGARYLSPELIERVVRGVEARLDQVKFRRIFKLESLRRKGGALSLACILILVTAFVRADLAGVWFQRVILLGNQPWPKSVVLDLVTPEGNPLTVALGDEIPVEVAVLRGDPEQITLRRWTAGGTAREEELWASPDGGFRTVLKDFTEDFSFEISGGDAVLEVREVKVQLRPRISHLALWCEYPEHTGREPTPASDPVRLGHLRVPENTRVRFRAVTSVPVDQAFIELVETPRGTSSVTRDVKDSGGAFPPAGSRPLELVAASTFAPFLEQPGEELSGSGLEGSFEVSERGYYRFHLRGRDGLTNHDPVTFRIGVIDDRPPTVRVLQPERISEEISPEATAPVRVRVQDDYGIRRVALEGQLVERDEQSVEDGKPLEVIFEALSHASPPDSDSDPAESSIALEAKELGLKPGNRLHFTVSALDFAGQTGRSETYVFHVVEKQEILQILYDRLSLVRDQVVTVEKRQASARKDLEEIQDQARLQETLSRDDASRLIRSRQDQSRVSLGIRRARQSVQRVLEKMESNRVGDDQERAWVRRLEENLAQLATEISPQVERQIQSLREQALEEKATALQLDPVIEGQRRVGRELNSLALTLMEFGDFNGILQRWRDLLRREEEILEDIRARIKQGSETR